MFALCPTELSRYRSHSLPTGGSGMPGIVPGNNHGTPGTGARERERETAEIERMNERTNDFSREREGGGGREREE